MLLTEYHPGHPSTENKFKIHMANLSSVNHSKSWAKNIKVGCLGFLHTSVLSHCLQVANSRPGGEFMKLPYIKISPYRQPTN